MKPEIWKDNPTVLFIPLNYFNMPAVFSKHLVIDTTHDRLITKDWKAQQEGTVIESYRKADHLPVYFHTKLSVFFKSIFHK